MGGIILSTIMTVGFSLVSAFAGDFLGNGGGGLECPDQPLQLFDFYEANRSGLGPVNLSDDLNDTQVMVRTYLERLALHSPVRAKSYQNLFDRFMMEATFIENLPLQEIPDLGVPIPPDCRWRQIVNQNPNLLSPGKKYLVDVGLWKTLSLVDQVGLIFHELIYRESNSSNSIGVRKLNALVATNHLNGLSLLDRKELFQMAGLPWVEAQGVQMDLSQPIQIENGVVKVATPIKGAELIWKGQRLALRADPIEFFDNGELKSIRIINKLEFQYRGELYDAVTDEYQRDRVEFYADHALRAVSLGHRKIWRILGPNATLRFSKMEFDQKGIHSKLGRVDGEIQIEGQVYAPRSESDVEFFESGSVKVFHWGDRNKMKLLNQEIEIQYDGVVRLNHLGRVMEFVAGSNGQFNNRNGRVLTYRKGEVVQLERD